MMTQRATSKNVLANIPSPQWGGLHAIVDRIAPHLRSEGWHLVACLAEHEDNGADRLRKRGVTVCEWPLGRLRASFNPLRHADSMWKIATDVSRFCRLIRRHDIDCVQVCGLHHVSGALAGALMDVPIVWQLHGNSAPAAVRVVFSKLVCRLADVVMTSGTGLEDDHPGISRFGERLIPFEAPVDTCEFRPDPDVRARARRALDVGSDRLLVGTVGRRGRVKRHDIFVRMARILSERCDNLEFRIIGKQVQSYAAEYRQSVVKLAEQTGLTDDGTLDFFDPGQDVASYMPALDVFVLTSSGEGASIVTREAMACGVPVVASDVGSLSDSVEHGTTGYLVDELDAQAFARSVERLVRDDELRSDMSQNARRKACEQFTSERCGRDHVRAYEMALQST